MDDSLSNSRRLLHVAFSRTIEDGFLSQDEVQGIETYLDTLSRHEISALFYVFSTTLAFMERLVENV